ncbi:hypothetical protein [Streptomyces sp. TP-A0356]|uniref:zinc finger domain-containing protein n=1 Tax=Streptomyces sp. TP-A0356 TaxID=1359208 RepID=UPI0006E29165|nr:hypothetical protein [Streptomyces sp. TP-A0356]
MTPTPTPAAVLQSACAEARARYARRVPEPRPTDFPCRWCRAPVGEPCTMRVPGRTGPHRPRESRWAHAFGAWQAAAEQACDDAVNVLHELARVLADAEH